MFRVFMFVLLCFFCFFIPKKPTEDNITSQLLYAIVSNFHLPFHFCFMLHFGVAE